MKKNNKIKIATWLSLIALVFLTWVIWFGYRKPQTVWQYVTMHMGFDRPDANANSQIVFLGDSITAFERWNILLGVSNITNAGASGNTTDDVLDRLSLVINFKPRKLFLMIGINDLLNGQDAAHVIANYEIILNRIKAESPNTLVYVQSLLPINNDVLKSETVDNQEIIAVNEKLKIIADKNGMVFVDLYSNFCGVDNKLYRSLSWDGLHPNSHGYAVWRDLVDQYIK
jgi:lysophospholipase L1-like esterase